MIRTDKSTVYKICVTKFTLFCEFFSEPVYRYNGVFPIASMDPVENQNKISMRFLLALKTLISLSKPS